MLLNPAVALLMGNPFAGSAKTLEAPNRPMPATNKVAIAMIRISFSSDEFQSSVTRRQRPIPARRSDRTMLATGHRMLLVERRGQAGLKFLRDGAPVHPLFICPVGDTDAAWASN
jgi:hypothetical protein